jgi:5-formyltetrahydrofolate cyclo-ligase
MSTDEVKSELRSFVRLTRGARSDADRDAATTSLRDFLDYLADEFSWRRIAAFIPTATEPPIAPGLDDLVRDGVTVIVPVATTDGLMEWIELEPGGVFDTTLDEMRMPIPTAGRQTPPLDLDAVFVPAAAVDRNGNRLGWGKGYYDRFLESVGGDPLVIAVVFDADVVDEVPVEAHDRTVGAILTESEIVFVQ